jgi:glycerol-3-phosphate dehydrogenase
MNKMFSSRQRCDILLDMEQVEFDLLVIGGGITGAGIALDAQSRGIRTALVEMQDYAAGTSSRSTKLVHGGLRYLKSFEIKMVAEVGKERVIVYENGPHVTRPEWMLLPIYTGGTFGKISTSLGLFVYDFLAGVNKGERRVMLDAKQTLEKEPLLRRDGLRGGGYYVEYRTDDARLTIEVLKRAVQEGAKAVNYAKVESFIYNQGKLSGVIIVDQLTGKPYSVKAKHIVNAAGPWVDKLREKDHSLSGGKLHLTKGVHLVIDGARFPLKQAVYFDTTDGRMIFAIPREGHTYIGTTDTNYKQDIARPRMTEEDRDYLLKAVNHLFEGLDLTPEDVESSWTGLRPLIHQEGKDPSEISRKDEVFYSDSGLISIAGGKLTGYRKMAETIVDVIVKQLYRDDVDIDMACKTKNLPISGGQVGGSSSFAEFVRSKTAEGVQLGIQAEEAEALTRRYGSNVDQVFASMDMYGTEAAKYELPLSLFGELMYTMDYEMVTKPEDFFIRRTSALYFRIDWVRQWMVPVIDCMAQREGWTDEQKEQYSNELQQYIDDAVQPMIYNLV